MMLGDMGNFMGNDGCQLTFIFCDQNKAGVDTNVASRAGKGVDTGVHHNEEGKFSALDIAVCQQAIA